MRLEEVQAPIEVLAKDRLGVIEIPTHVDGLRAAAGKHEGDERCVRRRAGGEDAQRIPRFQRLDRVVRRRADQSASMAEVLAPDLQRVGDVSQIEFGMTPQVLDQVDRRALQRRRLSWPRAPGA